MPRKIFSDGQEIIFQDINQMASAIEKELLDRIGYELAGRQTDCCFNDSFLVEYASASSVTVKAGVGFQTDGTQVDPEPTKRMLYVATQATKSLTAADGANARIDIVSIRANRATVTTETRNYKAVDGTLSTSSFVTETDWAADVLVTTGTPSGSPAVPSTPVGYIKIAELAVAASTGLPSTGGITDKRTVVLPGSSRLGIITKSANYTVTPMDELILIDGTATMTLPPAASCTGKVLRFKQINASGTGTIDGAGSETIDGALTQTLENRYAAMGIYSNGTGWGLL